MDSATRRLFDDLYSTDPDARYRAFMTVIAITDEKVGWAYEVWDEALAHLKDENNHIRAIAGQLLSNLAKSDPKGRMVTDFPQLLAATRDERFVTARHTLQSIWKVGAAGAKQQKMVVDSLARRFRDCAVERNCTLIRYDIQVGLRQLHDAAKDDAIRDRALALIEIETDPKYRKKYATAWGVKLSFKPPRPKGQA